MRIASNSVASGSTALQAAGAKTSSVSFLLVLASASSDAIQGAGSASSRSQARSNANAAGRTPSKDDKSPAPAASTDANPGAAPVPAPVEKPLPESDSNGPQQNDSQNNEAFAASSQTIDDRVSPAKPAPLQQVIAPLLQAPSASERTAPPQAQWNASLPVESSTAENNRITALAIPAGTSEDGSAFAFAVQASAGSFALLDNLVHNSNFANIGVLPSGVNANQHSIESSASKTSGNSLSVKPNSENTADTAKREAVASTPSQSSGAQSDGQSTQHSQADTSKEVAVAAKPSDNIAFPMSEFPANVALHESVASHSPANGTDNVPHRSDASGSLPSDQLNSGEAAGTSGINTARLIQTMGETEMRVGMHSSEFGDISIRTSVSQQQMVAQITTDHGDLGAAITAHIPSVQEKFGSDFGLHASIQLNQGGTSFSDERGNPSDRETKTAIRSMAVESAAPAAETDKLTLRAPPGANGEYRLDIRA